jgi:hypothetical protein
MAMLDRFLNSMKGPFRRRSGLLARRLTSEAGFAVPSVLLMTVAAMGVASVGVMTSVQGQGGTVRDQGSKTALAVAESGVEQALLHYNRGVAPCVPASEGDWCGPVTGMSVNGGTVGYWARLASGEECEVGNEVECVEIVSQGTVSGVTRRVNVYASTVSTVDSAGGGPFASASVLSLDTIELDSNSKIHTGTATNGDMILKSNAKQCGQASVGIGKKMETSSNAGYYSDALCKTKYSTVLQQELTLPPVNQGDAATNNDNGRFFALDTVSGNKADACWSGKRADGQTTTNCKTRELRVDNNSAVTLGGFVYSFCKLRLDSNSALYVQAGVKVTIYFDSPEACGYSSGVTQLDLRSNSRITSATGNSIDVTMLFVGSETRQTKIQLNSNTSVNGPCEQNFVIYAPRSDVDLDSNSKFCGAIAGKTVHLDSNAEIWTASGSDDFELPGVEIPETPAHYTPYRFVECGAVTASPPDAGC